MTRHFMRDTPLYQMEQMMMTPPYFKPRGHSLRRSGFRYQAKDVDCEYCMNYSRRNLCPLDQCICLEERIETGALSLEELLRDCLNSKPKMSLWRRLAQLLYQQSLQFFRTDEHRRRWMHWRTRYHRLSQRNQAALFLLTAYDDIWRRVIWKVEDNGFDFDSVRLAGIQPELYSVYQAAKAISIGSQNITIADLASRELVTDEAFQLIMPGENRGKANPGGWINGRLLWSWRTATAWITPWTWHRTSTAITSCPVTWNSPTSAKRWRNRTASTPRMNCSPPASMRRANVLCDGPPTGQLTPVV